jgi:hypothetical protein
MPSTASTRFFTMASAVELSGTFRLERLCHLHGEKQLIPLILLADFAGACEDCHAIDLPRVAATEAEPGKCTRR